MAYADYEYYTATYLGTAIEEADFPRLSLRASGYLDYITQGRAAKNAGLDALKMACCALAEQYQAIEAAQALAQKSLDASLSSQGAEVKSQTVGSWSKTYQSGGESAASAAAAASSAQAVLAAVARQYLGTTGLLYRGRGCGCGYVPTCCDNI